MTNTAKEVLDAHNNINEKVEKILHILDSSPPREALFIMALVNQSVNHIVESYMSKNDLCKDLVSLDKLLTINIDEGDQDE